MKLNFFIFLILLILCSCSSTPEKVKPIPYYELPSRPKSRVEYKNADGTITPLVTEGSKSTTIIDPKTGKKFHSEGWVDATKAAPELATQYQKLTNDEIQTKLANASPKETVLMIEILKSRNARAIKALASLLTDSRQAEFFKGREYWWYEKKGADPEIVEIRIYAALAIHFITAATPQNTIITMTDDKLIYATKDNFAINKEDLAKVWLKWWNDNKTDYN